jgi:nicotinamidase-related amidase
MKIQWEDTSIVFIDPQNEVLSEKGLAWPLVRESLQENNTIENMERIFKAAKAHGFEVFISPHYFYPTDKGWKFNGPLENDEATSGMFGRKGVLNLDGLEGSGADWLERFKPYIQDGKTIVVAPHRVFGPETNDLVLQLRKRKISKVILGGMLANMCVESHMRELLEQGFEVAVAKDATAAPKHPDWGYGYTAALINYAFLAHAVLTSLGLYHRPAPGRGTQAFLKRHGCPLQGRGVALAPWQNNSDTGYGFSALATGPHSLRTRRRHAKKRSLGPHKSLAYVL